MSYRNRVLAVLRFLSDGRRPVGIRHGFSLTELMVVMVIIGMLSTAVALAMVQKADTAKRTRVIADIATYEKAIDEFYAVQGRFPTNVEGLAILAMPTKNSTSGIIKKLMKDPWKHPYVYVTPGPNKLSYEIVSYGADGKIGGTEANADISSSNLENE